MEYDLPEITYTLIEQELAQIFAEVSNLDEESFKDELDFLKHFGLNIVYSRSNRSNLELQYALAYCQYGYEE